MAPDPKLAEAARLLREIYATVDRLEALHPGRSFQPDGHLVGSIGEAWAASLYGLTLLPQSHEKHDARAPDGRLVQVKATQGKVVGIRAEPEHLIVLLLDRNGEASEVYNGPGALAWSAAGKMQKNGQRPLGVARLRALMAEVPEAARVSRLDPH